MSNTFNRKLVDGEVALQLLQGLKDKIDASKVNASRVEGVLDISNIPQSALPTLKVVQNDTERFKLTSRDVKKGDTVKVIETNKLYLVTNMDRLSSEEGYTEYAQTVNWDTIKGRPETFTPSEHTQSTSTINSLQGYVKGDNTSALSTEDTLNVALGKLESIVGLKLNRNIPELKGSEKDVVESINKNVGQFIKGQVDNIDQITENGWYLCNSNCVGAPATFEGIVMNFNGGEGTSVKIWYSVTQESMYIKQTFPGVVKQEWTKVITKADVDNVKQELVQAMANKQNKRDETLLTNDKDINGAINELHGNKQDKNDGRLETSAKDIVEAINEVNKGKADKVHTHNDLYNTKEEILSALAKKEDTIVKNNAFNKSFGTTSGTVLEGDKYEDLLSTFESGQSRLEGVIQKKLDLSGGTIEGTLTVNGSLITKNNVGVQCKDNSGSPRTVVQVDTNNNIRLGDTTTPIIIDSDNVSLKGGNTLWTSGNFTPSEKQNANDLSLQTSAKNITGAINEVLTKTNEVSSNLSTKAPLEHIHDDRYTTTVVLDVRLSEIESNVATKEPVIKDKKTAFNKDFGTSVGTVLEGKHLSVLEGKIDEKQNKNDSSLQTSSKNIVGAINEIKANTLGSTGGKINGAINSIEHNGAGNYNIVASDERTVHGTLYGRVASSDGIGEVGLYNKKSEVGIRLKDNGTVLIDSKTLTTASKEMTGAINELVNKKFDKSGGDLIGNGEILRIKNNDSRGSAYISFYNGGTKKGWIGRGSSGIDSIAMHNQYSGKGLTLRHDGGTQIDALNLNTKTKEVISAINELNIGKLNIDGTNKMKGTLEFSHGTDVRPNIKFLSSDGSLHGALNSRSGDVDKDVYLENNVSGNGIYFKDNGEVKLSSKTIMNISAKTSMRISAPNLETNSKEVIGAINELRKAKSSPTSLRTDVDLNEITATGFYLLNTYEHTASNIPTKAKGQGFFLVVMRTGGNYAVQELTIYKTGERFLRAGDISSLPTWKELANETYLDKKFDKTGGTINGSVTVSEYIKTNVSNASAIQAVRGNYTAMMGCSSTVGDFVFGGKPNSKGDYESYIRIANNKCRYHNTSGEWDILHKGIFNPDTKLNTSGGTINGNLIVGTNSALSKGRIVGGGDTLSLAVPNDENNYITFVKSNASKSVRKGYIGFGSHNSANMEMRNDVTGKALTLHADGTLQYGGVIKSIGDQYQARGACGIDMNNSNIKGLNSLTFNDSCDSADESILFPKSGRDDSSTNVETDFDHIRAKDGIMYFNKHRVNFTKSQIITINGDANKYYPVRIIGGYFKAHRLRVSRRYDWKAPDSWNSPTHKGALDLVISSNFQSTWSGQPTQWFVERFSETYTNMVAKVDNYTVEGIWVWLRGGGADYEIEFLDANSDQEDLRISIYLGNVNLKELGGDSTILKPGTYSELGYANTVRSKMSWTTQDTPTSTKTRGYMKLPNGIIMQWGHKVPIKYGTEVSFPIAFPNQVTYVGVMSYGTGGKYNLLGVWDNSTNSKFTLDANTLTVSNSSITKANTEIVANWIAVGY